MTFKQFIYNILIFTSCVAIDQLSKWYAQTYSSIYFNKGIMFGIYADIPSLYRVTFLCSFFGYLFFFYLLLMYLLSTNLKWLKYGISILTGGIFGNVVDRTIYGKSIDFIPFDYFSNATFIYNIADILQWLGAGIIVYRIFKKEKIIWFPDNIRGKYFVYPKDQLRFAAKLAAIAFTTSFLLGLFSYTYFKFALNFSSSFQKEKLLLTFSLSYLSISMIFTLMVFIAGAIISHKTAGPLYAFERHVEYLLGGKQHKLVLRDGDNYKHLMNVASKLEKHFKETSNLSQ